jgi:hypothetical protein
LITLLVMVTLACTCSLPFNLAGDPDQPGDEPTHELDQGSDRSEMGLDFELIDEETGFILPEMPGLTIPLETGGSVFVPEGALPEGVEINAQASDALLLLPEGVQPVGDALIITADVQPGSPVLLRLPIPSGVSDPADLMIVRVEPDGMTTFLMTGVDGSDLVAFTPGFSKFSVVQFVGEFMREYKPFIYGYPKLLPGQSGTFFIMDAIPGGTFTSQWAVTGDVSIQHQDDVSVTITAGQAGGAATVSYAGIDLRRGLRLFSSRSLSIMPPEVLATVQDSKEGFQIAITSNKPKVFEGEALNVMVSFHGHYRLPVLWAYRIDDCHEEVDVITSDHQPVPLSFSCPPGKYYLIIFAEYLTEEDELIKNVATQRLDVLARPMMVQLAGPTELEWRQQGTAAVFTAEASGGNPGQAESQKALYDFSWRVQPGGEWVNYGLSEVSITDQEFTFAQPGDYRVEVLVKNQDGEEVSATLPVLVTGAEPLAAQILSWPDAIKPDEAVSLTFRASGGTLINAGQKGGYNVSIYWGDGSMDEDTNVGIASAGYQAEVLEKSHQWAEPGPYTVMLFVEDPSGSIAYAEAEIVVQEPKPAAYSGEVFLATDPQNLSELTVLESQVDLTVTDETVSADMSFSYSYFLSIESQDNPDENCVGIFEFAFSGQGPLTNPLSLEMAQTHFKFSEVGPSCDKRSSSDPVAVASTTLSGTFFEDGSFYGTLDPEQFSFRFFGVSAERVQE